MTSIPNNSSSKSSAVHAAAGAVVAGSAATATATVTPHLASAHGAEWPEGGLRLRWRILLTVLLLLLVAIFSILLHGRPAQAAAPAAAPAQSLSDPLVLAFYYSWFDENTWNGGQLSDLPAERYVSADRGVMGRHIDQAKAAGIDALIVAWYGPNGDSNQTEANLRALLDEAAARNFRIGILFETDSPFLGDAGSVAGALQHALSVHAAHPAYLRVDGKPVIFFWRSSLYGTGAWASIRGQVDAGYNSLWIGEGVDTSHLSVFDGHFLYSNTWNPPADLTAVNQKFAGRVAAMREATGAPKLWVATVMPGYNDVGVRPNSGFARGRDGGAYYAQSWQAAIASNPNWVVVTSFNEWPEGTYIEPSAAYGDAYLGLTAQYAAQFRGGGGVPVLPAAPAAAETETTAADAPADPVPVAAETEAGAAGTEPEKPTVFVLAGVLNLRAGPGTGYAVLGAVVEGDALPVLGQSAGDADGWWQVDTAAGPAWLIGEHVRAAGPLEGVPVVAAPEAATVEPENTADTADTAGTAAGAAPAPAAGLTITIGGTSVTLRPAGGQ